MAARQGRLYRYVPTVEPDDLLPTPILFVMSLVTTAKVFDLQEDNSLIRRFLDAGHDVYLLDWGVPDAVESKNTLETYCDEYLPRAVRAVVEESGSEDLNLFGYCLGAGWPCSAWLVTRRCRCGAWCCSPPPSTWASSDR